MQFHQFYNFTIYCRIRLFHKGNKIQRYVSFNNQLFHFSRMNDYTYDIGYFSGSVFQETSGSNQLDYERIYGRLYYTYCNIKICKKKFEVDFTEREKIFNWMKICLIRIYLSQLSSRLLLHSYTVHAIHIRFVVKIS